MNAADENVIFRPVGDIGIMVEFGSQIDDDIHQRVVSLDHAIKLAPIDGVREIVPSYTSVFIGYDPLITNYSALKDILKSKIALDGENENIAQTWTIPVCYDGEFAPDIKELSDRLSLSKDQIINLHLSGKYKVYMYGFAPGYAYLGGVPKELQLPRKPNPVMNVAKASVMIAGPQCLVSTLKMPSGWWVIGQAADTPLQTNNAHPFLFNVGDMIKFERVSEDELSAHKIRSDVI